MIKNIRKIKGDVKKRKATKATNSLQLISNGFYLLKKGFKLLFKEIFSR
tara:strand:- start:5673 stop:5819 length:147 start_codon:yes stop_codon:yes gene_type:complete